MNTYVGRIARRQAVIGGFTVASSPSLSAYEDENDDDGSPSDDEMST